MRWWQHIEERDGCVHTVVCSVNRLYQACESCNLKHAWLTNVCWDQYGRESLNGESLDILPTPQNSSQNFRTFPIRDSLPCWIQGAFVRMNNSQPRIHFTSWSHLLWFAVTNKVERLQGEDRKKESRYLMWTLPHTKICIQTVIYLLLTFFSSHKVTFNSLVIHLSFDLEEKQVVLYCIIPLEHHLASLPYWIPYCLPSRPKHTTYQR